MTATKRYMNMPTRSRILRYFDIGGAGVVGAHAVLTDSEIFEGDEDHYIYALKPYSDATTFDTLEENGESVGSVRLTCAGIGYPAGDTITGKFTKVVPATGKVLGAYIINLKKEED